MRAAHQLGPYVARIHGLRPQPSARSDRLRPLAEIGGAWPVRCRVGTVDRRRAGRFGGHVSRLFVIPDGSSDEAAVPTDPVSVFAALDAARPAPGG